MRPNRNTIIPWGCVFKVIFPNGKIYVGSDTAMSARSDFFKYFGTPISGKEDMLNDMESYLAGVDPYILKKEILYSRENVKIGEILKKEQEYINSLDSKNPSTGYNRYKDPRSQIPDPRPTWTTPVLNAKFISQAGHE